LSNLYSEKQNGEIGVRILNYHLILTRRCNLNCIYCHGGEETGPNTEIQYSLGDLEAFLSRDIDPQLMLYGGEPTLRIPLIIALMDQFPTYRFMLQTNGILINNMPTKYINRFHSILISIDGPSSTTDYYRSQGVHDKVIENTQFLIDNGFKGDIVARMAVSEQSDIYRDVRYLIELGIYNHVHWQLNVIWDAEGNWTDFDKWVINSYNPGITRLVDEWVEKLEEGIVEGIVPFLPLMYSILTGERSYLRCGSGIDTFAIHVDGSIGVCPISPDWDFSIVGSILDTNPQELPNIMPIEEPCPSCDEYDICGGRCLFTNKQKLWGKAGFDKVCNTVRHLISALRKKAGRVQELIDAGVIDILDFKYPEYNNGCEIIP